jgi:tetratricopeptide (TPR) repeat protein
VAFARYWNQEGKGGMEETMKTGKPLIVLLLAVVLGLALGGMARAQSASDYFYRGLEGSKKGHLDQAIADFTKALELNPRAECAYNRGYAYSLKGQWDQAIADYTKALELNPRAAAAYRNRAKSFYYKKEYGRAWEDVQKAQSLGIKIDPKFLENLRRASGRER